MTKNYQPKKIKQPKETTKITENNIKQWKTSKTTKSVINKYGENNQNLPKTTKNDRLKTTDPPKKTENNRNRLKTTKNYFNLNHIFQYSF